MYEVIRPIATGHQGTVHLARRDDGELVALKRLALVGDPAQREVARRRLRREAELLRRAEVDGVVPLLDVVEEDGDLVLVMPHLAGGSLHDLVHAHGPVPPERFAALATPLLRTLAAVHRKGVLHRDVKPSNVLFHASGGRPWLADFGIATARDVTEGLSAAGHLLGTPSFIAPERARGEAATPASDVYSLGATLRFALTGMPPHGVGDVVSIVARAAAGRIEPLPPGTHPHLVQLLDRMCALDPADRPTAAALVAGPDGTAVGLAGVGSPTTTDDGPGGRRRPLRRALAAAGAAALLLLGVAVGVLAADRIDSDGRADAAAGTLGDLVDPTTTTAPEPTTTTTACVDLPYQGCDDAAPAPGTDGEACLDGRFDHDEDPANGCEAEGDDIDDAEVRSGSIQGTIIPVGDGDKLLLPVSDRWQFLCDGRLTLTLTAPEGLDLEMRVFDRGDEIALLEVAGGDDDRVRLSEPSCANNDTTTLEVVIRGTDGRSSDPWTLERSGSW
ncbi:serine/threonine-protein kinase [Actinomarinicola tropica]|uniref:non-specific serine/threonine protein kinase n=1 Tax=Actinomarinicola tropica TaxID=2789776 RepID=A0A5Q2RRV5_9ACTN|nr:serine/threonine-protein kinase [Actinomarinicola tropica]QGG96630.1 protein kinase [Actinomarinicola tropica]